MKNDARNRLLAAGPSSVALAPLDMAVEYLRAEWTSLLLPYALAMAPFTAAVYFIIDALAVGHRSFLYAAALYLLPAYVARWGGVGYLQKKIGEDLGATKTKYREIVFDVILIRLLGAIMMTWGAVFFIPPFYAFFTSAIAASLLAEEEGSVYEKVVLGLTWIQKSWARLFKMASAMFVCFAVVATGLFIVQALMESAILGGILDLNTTDMAITMNSAAWVFSVLYLVFLAFDFYWSVASVFVFNDLRRRRLGVDLRARIEAMSEAAK